MVHSRRGEYALALGRFEETLRLSEEVGFKRGRAQALHEMGRVFLLQDEPAKALTYSLRSAELAEELALLELLRDNHQLLATAYAQQHDFQRAYEHHRLFKQFNDSTFNANSVRRIADMQSAYQFDKERQLFEAEQQKKDLAIESQRTIIVTLAVAWDYTEPFIWDGTTKTVTLTGLPEGVSAASYSGNTATETGTYTASVVLDCEWWNYNMPEVPALNWTIEEQLVTSLTAKVGGRTQATVYPNPLQAGNTLLVEMGAAPTPGTEVQVLNLTGSAVRANIMQEIGGYRVSGLTTPGIYFVRISSPHKSAIILKVLVQ